MQRQQNIGMLARALSGRDALRHLSINPFDPSIPVGQELACPTCGSSIALTEITNRVVGTLRFWSECPCVIRGHEQQQHIVASSARYQAEQRGDRMFQRTDIGQFTFDTFEPDRLVGGAAIIKAALRWLEQIQTQAVATSYNGDPRCCLYFYSPGKGRGKTHVAAAMANSTERSTFFADEIGFVSSVWGAELSQRDILLKQPGERAWLTVLDDMGQRTATGAGLQDIWYEVINRRWLKRGWTIITSNYTPEELLERGTINEATHSRLIQMTRGQLVVFDGKDQRLPQRYEHAPAYT